MRVFLAGGVPEVMLHLRRLGLLALDVLTVTGQPLGAVLDDWEKSARRRRFPAQFALSENQRRAAERTARQNDRFLSAARRPGLWGDGGTADQVRSHDAQRRLHEGNGKGPYRSDLQRKVSGTRR